jgi:recombination protein U
MEEFEQQDGVAFFLIYFSSKDMFYYLRFAKFMEFYKRKEQGGRKSFRLEELEESYFFPPGKGVLVPYLDKLAQDIEGR